MIEILVIGYGNIAKKHIRLINKFLPSARFFVKAKNYLLHKNENHVKLIRKLDKYIIKRIKYILICSPSNSHLNYLSKLIKKNKIIFVEKPLSNKLINVMNFNKKRNINKKKILIGYVFRHNKVAKKIKKILTKKQLGKIYQVEIKYSSYLPDWRKNKDYTKTVSASKKYGGGVLLELSHEIDYMIWFFGFPKKISAKIYKNRALKIDVESGVDLTAYYDNRLKINLHLDFHSKNVNQRYCKIFGEKKNIIWDLNKNMARIQNKKINKSSIVASNKNMFEDQMKFFLHSSNKFKTQTYFQDSIKVLKVIEASKLSSKRNISVYV